MFDAIARTVRLLTIAAVGLLAASSVSAEPQIWEKPNIGPPLLDFDTTDDGTQNVQLSFDFPYDGAMYDVASVNHNGGIALTDDIEDLIYMDYNAWRSFSASLGGLDENFTDLGVPALAPFLTDLDPDDGDQGTIHFRDFGDRAVFTWLYIAGQENDSEALISFQVILHDDGRIIYGYNGIFSDLEADLGQGIVVGISNGAGDSPPPGSDYTDDGPFSGGTTIYEVWCSSDPNDPECHQPGQDNDQFDLNDCNVIFTPDNGGYEVETVCAGGERILVSPSVNRVVSTTEGAVVLYQQRVYELILNATGRLERVETVLALGSSNLDCVAWIEPDVSVAFSTATDGILFTPQGLLVLQRQNVYKYDLTNGGAVTLLVDGGTLGIDIDACDF